MDDLKRGPGPGERTGVLALLALVPAILAFDYAAGRDFSLHLFYLVPTGLAAWNFGTRAGFAVALVAGTYWAWTGFALHHPQAGRLALAWDVASTVLLFLVFAYVIGRHRRLHDALVDNARLDLDTGALSGREFARVLENESRRARRYRHPLAILVFDAASERDATLRGRGFMAEVVDNALKDVRGTDAVGRLAERRVGLLLVECPAEEAMRVAARLQERLATALRVEPPPVGVVTFGGEGAPGGTELLEAAAAQLAAAQGGARITEKRIA